MTKKLLFSCVCFLLCAITVKAAAVSITGQAGWFESAYVTWQKTAGLKYNVYASPASSNTWTKLDNELVREYPDYGRADALGLTAGSYKFKVVPVSEDSEITTDAAVSEVVTVKAHDRSGFAHVGMSGGIGAYKNDGTLKQGARVLYVWADNAKTVTLDVKTSSSGATTKGTGLQDIIYLYQKGYDTTPLAIRIIGTIKADDMDRFDSSAEGLQVKGKNAYSDMPITIEGVGNDAAFWGFGILCRNCKGTEFRNFAIMLCMDDALSLDTYNSNVWVHNMDFFYGNTGGDADQAKGDGTVDIKGKSQNITVSYNHFVDCGKTSLGGMKSETTDCWMTYHHNWFDHSDSRHPRIRTAFYHVYNNYFDGVSKYGIGVTCGGSAFVENNYFRNCKYPMLISKQGTDAEGAGTFSGEEGGVIKAYNNTVVGARKLQYWSSSVQSTGVWDAVLASSRDASVSATAFSGSTSYNSAADQAARTSYIENKIDEPDDVKTIVKGDLGAGRMQHGDFLWSFNNSLQDANYGVIPELKNALQSYKTTLVGFFGQAISNGGATTTVDAGDGKGISDEVNDAYVPEWGSGGGSGTITAGEYVIGSSSEYFWFNEANATAYNAYIADGTLTTNGSFEPKRVVVKSDGTTYCSGYIGAIRLDQNEHLTVYYADGISSANFYVSGTGTQNWKMETSNDGTNWTTTGTVEGNSGSHPACNITPQEPIKYVRIINTNSSTRDLQGVKVAKPGEGNPDVDPGDDNEDPLSSDASAEFTLNGDEIVMSGNAYTLNVAYDADDAAGYNVIVTPVEGATIAAVTGATGSNGSYTIYAPAAGQTQKATFRLLAENQANTRTYTISIIKAADPSTQPVTDGEFLYFPTKSIPNDSFFTIANGNLGDPNKYGSTTYTKNGETYNCAYPLKIESSTSIKFTPVKDGMVKIGLSTVGDNNLIVNGSNKAGNANYVVEFSVDANTEYIITRAKAAYLFYIDLVYAGADNVLRGDADGNGEVQPADVLALANHLIGKTPENFNATAADVKKDGKVDISDLAALIKLLIP